MTGPYLAARGATSSSSALQKHTSVCSSTNMSQSIRDIISAVVPLGNYPCIRPCYKSGSSLVWLRRGSKMFLWFSYSNLRRFQTAPRLAPPSAPLVALRPLCPSLCGPLSLCVVESLIMQKDYLIYGSWRHQGKLPWGDRQEEGRAVRSTGG